MIRRRGPRLKTFNDEESSDVVFEIGSKEVEYSRKKMAKTSPTALFYAHRFILE